MRRLSALELLPVEIKCHIFEYVFTTDWARHQIFRCSNERCLCPIPYERDNSQDRTTFASRAKIAIRSFKAGLRSGHRQCSRSRRRHVPDTTPVNNSSLFISRTLYGDAIQAMFRMRTLCLTSMETLRLVLCPGLSDLIEDLVIFERRPDESVFRPDQSSCLSRTSLITGLHAGARLRRLSVDLDPLQYQQRSGPFVEVNLKLFLSWLGLEGISAHCTELGQYSLDPGQGLDKLSLFHGQLTSLWSNVTSESSLPSPSDTWSGLRFSGERWWLFHVPPLCVRLQSVLSSMIQSIHTDLLELERDNSLPRLQSWLWWLDAGHIADIDCNAIMPGKDSRLNEAWTSLLANRIAETRSWIISQE